MTDPAPAPLAGLHAVVGEVETHVAEAGWDQPAQLFALVETEELLRAEPQLAASLGLVATVPGALTPIAQDALPAVPIDEALAEIAFTQEVLGVVLVQEVLVLPPGVEDQVADAVDPATFAAGHPERREVRMVVGVVRDGTSAAVLRLRGAEPEEDERVTGPDLVPGLAVALLETLV